MLRQHDQIVGFSRSRRSIHLAEADDAVPFFRYRNLRPPLGKRRGKQFQRLSVRPARIRAAEMQRDCIVMRGQAASLKTSFASMVLICISGASFCDLILIIHAFHKKCKFSTKKGAFWL